MLGRRQVPYPYGIRRRRQHLNKASGRGWGLEGRPSGLRATWLLRLSSSLGFLPRSRRLPHPVGSDLRQVRPLRPLRRAAAWSAGAAAPDAWGSAWGPSWASQPGAPVGPGAAAAAGLAAAASTQVRPQAPAGQPGTAPQGPVRPGEPTGRTPAAQGGAPGSPVAPPSGPQARVPAGPAAPPTRMPGPPMQPAAPSAIPVPGQEKDTVRNQPVDAGLEAHHAAKPKVGIARRTRKARLRLSRLDPWSVMKTSFLFSIAAGIMLVAAVYSIWTVLSTSQLFDSINDIVRSVVSTPGDTTPFRIQEYINTQKVMGVTALIACVDVVIFTALATLGSFLYNLAATMLGGLEITLAED